MRVLPTSTRWLCVLAALLVLPLTDANAQLSAMQAGAKVRVRADGMASRRITGVVIARTADSLTLSGVPPLVLATASLTDAEISRGRSRSRGAVKGLAWGAAIGGVIGLALLPNTNCSPQPCKNNLNTDAAIGALLGGLLYGAGIGALVKSERWEKLSLSPRDDLR